MLVLFAEVSGQIIGPIFKGNRIDSFPETSVRNIILRWVKPQNSADIFSQQRKPKVIFFTSSFVRKFKDYIWQNKVPTNLDQILIKYFARF